MQDKKTWLTVSILKFTPPRPMTIHCTVFNDAFPSPKLSETIKLNFRDYMQPQLEKFTQNQQLDLECEEGLLSHGKQYKWIINGNELAGETENILKILQINESYDSSTVKCLSYNTNKSQFVLVNNFKLKYVENKSEILKPEAMAVKSIIPVNKNRSNKSKSKSRTQKRVFTCVTEDEIEEDPKYIWVDGKLEISTKSLR